MATPPPTVIASALKSTISKRRKKAAFRARCESSSKRLRMRRSARFALTTLIAANDSCRRDVRSLLASRFSRARRRIRGVYLAVNQMTGTATAMHAKAMAGVRRNRVTSASPIQKSVVSGPISASCRRFTIIALSW